MVGGFLSNSLYFFVRPTDADMPLNSYGDSRLNVIGVWIVSLVDVTSFVCVGVLVISMVFSDWTS